VNDTWSVLFTLAWPAWFLVFLALEAVALRRRHDRYPTLTQTVHRFIPAAITAAFIVWLAWHFWVTYTT
jgi:hypothetical protein